MKHLLLLHGAIGAQSQFNLLAESLKTHGVVHTIDFSGHGGKAVHDDFSIGLFAEDVLNYLSVNKIANIDIFGYSMGGYVALFLAKNHPEKVGKVFTLATKFNWTPEIAQRETKMLDPNKIVEKIPVFAQQLKDRHGLSDWKAVLSKTADMMRNMGEDNPLKNEDYVQIRHQVLLGIGDKDAMVTLDETIAVYKLLPNANLVVLPDTQHPLEKVGHARLLHEITSFFT